MNPIVSDQPPWEDAYTFSPILFIMESELRKETVSINQCIILASGIQL